MKEREKEIDELTTALQKECHHQVEFVEKHLKKEFNYQDATNAYIFRKIAELAYEIKKLQP